MNNEFNISIKDFQIIKSASLTFKPGLNCIIGQSNNGKSAIFRAAKACIYNTPGTTQVRLGASNYAVGIQANGHTVILQKGTNNIYKIDGKLYEKIGRTQVPEVAEALRIADIPINGTTEEINFQDQMEKPFLLDRSETDLFRFIVDSGKDSNVTLALKTITQDRQQKTKDITITEGALSLIEDNLKTQEEKLKNSDLNISICDRVIALGPKIKSIEDIKNLSSHIEELTSNKQKLEEDNKNTSTLLDKVSPIMEVLKDKVDKQNVINTLANRVDTSKQQLASTKVKLDSLGNITDTKELSNNLDKYKSICELESRLNGSKNALNEMQQITIPELNTTNFDKYKAISEIVAHIDTSNKDKSVVEDKLKEVKEELSTLQKEIESIGICPTCGRPLSDAACII